MMRARPGGSLAARLVGLFVLGSFVIMSGAGYALYHALGMQLDAQNLAEMRGKTEVVQHILKGIHGDAAVDAHLAALRDISVGHPHLSVGVYKDGRWLVPPPKDLSTVAAAVARGPEAAPYVQVNADDRTWWLHRVDYRWEGARPGQLDVVLLIEVTETRQLLRQHAVVAIMVVLIGVFASTLLAWFVARRGLAPLAQLAERAEAVTAQQLGSRLNVKDAPAEVQGLADSINRMFERLEQSFRDLEQFSADIAHELRTPINNLLLQTQVTLSRPRSEADYREAMHSNLDELERLQRMVAEMLFLARADRRLLELAEEEVDLGAEAASVADYFDALVAEKSQRLEIHGSGTVRTDRSMARRAITNLVSNAVRYAPEGSTLGIEVGGDATEATVTVSNPGRHIPEPELRRLFSRFARRDESRAREMEGTGLGLAIVESVMQLLGGTVRASSAEGIVRFVLAFPRARVATQA
jgi:two-component system heavy metal sensor histidine kinase CusS